MGEGQARLAWLLFKQSWGLQEEPASQGRWESFSEREGWAREMGEFRGKGEVGFGGDFSHGLHTLKSWVAVLAGSLWRLHQR